MTILKIFAFCMPLIGLCGIAGAVETGTSPVNASILFLVGCFVMAAYIRQEGWAVIMEGKGEMEMKRPFISHADELREMCQPIISYLEKHGDPYSEVHISMDGIKITSVQCGIPAKAKDD